MNINDIKHLPVITEEKMEEMKMSKNYVEFYKNGNKTKINTTSIKYFKRDEYGKQIIPEEKPVKDNAVPKMRAEYVTIDAAPVISKTRLINSKTMYDLKHNLVPQLNLAYKILEEAIENIKKPDEIPTIEALTYVIDKNGERLERKIFNIHEFNNYCAEMVYGSQDKKMKAIRSAENFHVFDPKNIANYCIIDHVNSLSGGIYKRDEKGRLKDTLLSELYDAAYRQAEEDGFEFEQRYTMKKFCKALNGSPSPSKKYKTWVRRTYFPKKVYLICDSIDNYDAKYAYKCWADRKVDVMVIQANTEMLKYKYHNFTEDRNRKVAETWSSAIGWEFETPLYRTSKENNLDIYAVGNKEKRQELINRNVKVTKVTSRTDKFIYYNSAIVPDNKVSNMVYHAVWEKHQGLYDETIQNGNGIYKYNDTEEYDGIMKERPTSFLDIDTVICACCGRPRPQYNYKDRFQNITNKIICPNCEAEFDSDGFEFVPYFEDNYNDEFDTYLDDIIASIDSEEDFDE